MEQKVIRICMDSLDGRDQRELLNEYLQDGWRVVNITPLNGSSAAATAFCWIIVLLEKD